MRDKESIRETFRRDGVVRLPGFLNPAEIDELDAKLSQYISQVVPNLPPADAFYEVGGDRRILKQMQRLSDHEPYFDELQRRPKYLQLAESLLDGPVRLQGVEWFNKPARIVRRGDALVHHSATIHWATANTSSRERRAFAVVYFSARARRDEEAFARYLASSRSQQKALGAL